MSSILPDGFTLDKPAAGGLPPGYTPDQPGGGEFGFAPAPPEVTPNPKSIQGAPIVSPTPADWGSVGTVAADAWRGGQVSKEEIDKANQGDLLSRYLISPMLQVSNWPIQATNALFRGGQQAVQEAVTQLAGPVAGRTIASIPEAFFGSSDPTYPFQRPVNQTPVGVRGRFGSFDFPEPPPPASSVPSFVSERTAPPRDPGMSNAERIQQLVEHGVNEAQPVMGPPMARGPLTEQSPLAPQVGPDGSLVPPGSGYRQNVDPTKPFTYDPPSAGWPAGTEQWAGNWRPVGPQEVFQPGRQFRMNQTTGQSEVFEPAATAPTPAAPTSTAPMTADEILARSKGYYSPADQQASQGATINPAQSDAIRGVLTDAVPTDPQTAIAKGSTPLTQLGKDYADFQGQPMSFDTVMQLDRRLTAEKQTAMSAKNNDLARQIGEAQDAIRDKMQSLGPNDTTGDATALASLASARQAYSQYIKQSQLEDIQYGASLADPAKQDAYVRSRATALLKSPQSNNWTPDERAALETAATQGAKSFLGNAAISMIKPAATGLGFKMFGPGGAWLGSNIGEAGQSMARDALARRRPDRLGPVSGTITQGVPSAPVNRLAPGASPP